MEFQREIQGHCGNGAGTDNSINRGIKRSAIRRSKVLFARMKFFVLNQYQT